MAGSIGNEDILTRKPVAPLGLIPLKSIESIGSKVDKFLLEWRAERPIDHLDTVEQQDYAKDTYIINAKCPRFGSGEAKATISGLHPRTRHLHPRRCHELLPDLFHVRADEPYVARRPLR